MYKRIIKRLWNSPTFTTWGSFLGRSFSFILPLPFLLPRFTPEETAVWYLFITIMGMVNLVDMGFGVTFTRALAYGMGGAINIRDFRDYRYKNNNENPNWQTISNVVSTMYAIYNKLFWLAFFLLSTLGSIILWKPISQLLEVSNAWLAWLVIIISSTILIRGNIYSAYLQGLNKIALFRRWEAITYIGAIITNISVLLISPGLLQLVITNQCWVLVSVLRNWWLCNKVEHKKFRYIKSRILKTEIFNSLWPSVWRSGLGVFMSRGLVEASGLIFAQFGSTDEIVSYLLALRLMYALNQFSQAPFYSKLPLLARLRAQGKVEGQVEVARKGMRFAFWVFVLGFVLAGFFVPLILSYIDSNTGFVSSLLWSIMGLAFLAERYGSMHIQLYSTTNHIIWHIANGVTGTIYLIASLVLFPYFGIYSFPLGMLIGYLGFYCWYASKHSYQAFDMKFWNFENSTLFRPLAFQLIYTIGVLIIGCR